MDNTSHHQNNYKQFKWKKLLHQLSFSSLSPKSHQLQDTVSWTTQCKNCSQAPKSLQPLVTPQEAAGHHICFPATQTLSSSKTNCALE